MHRDMLEGQVSKHRSAGHGVVLVGYRSACLGLVAFSDPLRTTAKDAVAQLRADG